MQNEFHLPSDHELNLKNLLAIDFGEKVIGLATYCVNRDPYPTPYGRIINKGLDSVKKELTRILDDECIDIIIVGLPRLTDGQETQSTERARQFLHWVSEQFSQKVYEQDETLSTFEATERMKSSPRYNFTVDLTQIDAVSASIILEDFIRRNKASFGL
ncbi:MAG: Holliday junction resolvase RuvX [Candidatus Caldatribacteriota bacterium]